MAEWKVEFIKEAQKDLKRLDPHDQKLILKAIIKTSQRPLPPPDGIGKPLGNRSGSDLAGYYKIKLRDLGYRVVYPLEIQGGIMRVIVISVRAQEQVYKEAERRIRKMEDK